MLGFWTSTLGQTRRQRDLNLTEFAVKSQIEAIRVATLEKFVIFDSNKNIVLRKNLFIEDLSGFDLEAMLLLKFKLTSNYDW